MTVAIRTLQQNANQEGDCLTIPDSSATQRVSASPATTGARTMTAWTQDLIYAAIGSLSWQSRYRRDTFLAASHGPGRAGERYDQILAFAYPDNSLSRWELTLNLPVITQSESLAGEKMPQWRRILQGETGTTNQTCLRSVV